jgi:hypothetical protein
VRGVGQRTELLAPVPSSSEDDGVHPAPPDPSADVFLTPVPSTPGRFL